MKLIETFKGHWQLAVMTALVFSLWQYPLMYPLRMFVIFLHESSHALVALMTGAEVLSLSLDPREGGSVLARGGNGFLIASAGYLGSLILGCILFLLALRTKVDRAMVAILGVIMLILTALYIREPFPLMFCIGGAVFFLISARFLGQQMNDLLLRLIGLTSMIYVPYDVFSDTLARSHLRSDARILAENYGGTTMMWGGLWLVISLAFLVFIARVSLRRPSNIEFGDKSASSAPLR